MIEKNKKNFQKNLQRKKSYESNIDWIKVDYRQNLKNLKFVEKFLKILGKFSKILAKLLENFKKF